MNFSKTHHFFVCLCFALFITACTGLRAAPDLIFYNGKILTVDKKFSIVAALAVKDGSILMLGASDEVLLSRGTSTQVLDLEGKMLMPGLIDSHTHPISASLSEYDHAIPGLQTIAALLAHIKTRAKTTAAGEWLWIDNEFFTRLKELRLPTAKELDRVSPNHPVVYIGFSSSPSAVLNSLALKSLGIDKHFAAAHPEDIDIDPFTAEPSGIVHHPSKYLPKQKMAKEADLIERQKLLRKMLGNYNAVGITSISDRNASAADVALYQALKKSKQLSTRIRIMHKVNTWGASQEAILNEIKQIAEHPLRKSDPMLEVIGIKTKLDGGILTGTAYMIDAWGEAKFYPNKDKDYRGGLFLSKETLQAMVRTSVGAGLQFAGHAVGDAAVQTLMEVYAKVNETDPIRETRAVITHANFINKKIINDMAAIGILADVQPAWLFLDSRMLLKQFGDERLRYFQALSSLFKKGVIVGGGSDHWFKGDSVASTNPYNPFLAMWVSIKRQPRFSEEVIHAEEALTREQAIRLYTSNNAYMLFMEDQIGSLEPGKSADMIILDRDILTCDIDALRRTQVLQTYLNGKLVHAINGESPPPSN